MLRARLLAWPTAVLLLVTVLLPAGAQSRSGEAFVVPEGDVRTVALDFATGSLVVLGTLRAAAPGDLTIHADSVRVGPRGLIEALPGASGAGAEGPQALGGDGANGGSITIVTGLLVVEEGGWILAGKGGAGGSAASSASAWGGDGGDGGSVHLAAATAHVLGHVVPGAGGHGGPAAASDLRGTGAEAAGGDGGSAGKVFLDGGLALGLLNGPLPAAPPSSLQHEATGPASLLTTCPTSLPTGGPGLPGAPAGGAGGEACAVSQGNNGANGMSCSGTATIVTSGDPGEQATATSKGGRGGEGVSRGGDGGVGEAYAYGGHGGIGGSGWLCGRPGASGGSGGTASAEATGGTGGIALVAVALTGDRGGDGGAATAEAWCGDGGDGGSGVAVGAGPGGGHGGQGGGATGADGACKAAAEGGKAGEGDPPGDSGDARAKSKGGKGGNGGNGNSPGGDGGDGGNTFAAPIPGAAPLGGSAGTGVAEASPGAGGSGGPGDPYGADGSQGIDFSPGSSPPVVGPPAGPSSVLARSFLDIAAGFDVGEGLGLYEPTEPTYCLALLDTYQGVSPVLLYYAGLRYWVPADGVGPVPVDLYVPEPTNCAGFVPGDQVGVDSLQVDAGGAFWSSNLLGATEVANLGSTSVLVNYCLSPYVTIGSNGLVAAPGVLEAFGAEALNCATAWSGSYVLFPGCDLLSASTSVGEFSLDSPVFLRDGGCNSLQGAPSAGDYAVRHCVSVDVFDVVLGTQALQDDEDHFVVFGAGNLLAWATTFGTPSSMFPNVSSLEQVDTVC